MEAGRRLGRSLRKWENVWERIFKVHPRVARQSQNKQEYFLLEYIHFLSLRINPKNQTGRLPWAWICPERQEKRNAEGHFWFEVGRNHDGRGQYFGGNQGAWAAVSTRGCAHIRWKIKQAGISAHKGSGNMALPCSHSWTKPSKFCAKS